MSQKTFSLTKRLCEVSNLNTRAENHGQRDVPAFDVSVKVPFKRKDIDQLIGLESSICDSIFAKDGSFIGHVLSPMSIDRSPERLEIIISDEIGDMTFLKGKINGFKLEFSDGEQALASFKVQFSIDDEKEGDRDEDIARLVHLQKQKGKIKIKAMDPGLFDDKEESSEVDSDVEPE